MKKQIVFIKGGEAFSNYEDFLTYLKTVEVRDPAALEQKRWTRTLQDDLGEAFEVFIPTMPNKQNAKYEEWKIWFERHFQFLHDDVVLIGHSQGGYFLLKYLSENAVPVKVKALYLLAAPAGPDDFGGEDGGDFAFDPYRLKDIMAQVKDIHILHSTDDPVVPYSHAEKLKAFLPKAELITFEDRGHFLMETFPELIDHIKENC